MAVAVACRKLAYEHRVAVWCSQFLADLHLDSDISLVRLLRERSLLSVVRDRLGAISEAEILELLEAQPVPQTITGAAVLTQAWPRRHCAHRMIDHSQGLSSGRRGPVFRLRACECTYV